MRVRSAATLAWLLLLSLACARGRSQEPVPAASETPRDASTSATSDSAAASQAASRPSPESIQAAIEQLARQRGVSSVSLSPDGGSLIVRLCAADVESGLDRTGAPLPVIVEREPNPRAEGSRCGCLGYGQYYAPGEAMPSIDNGCNRCWCNATGNMACTLLNCTVEVREAVRFTHGKADLDAPGRALLDEVVAVLKDRPSFRGLRVVGHAGTAERNPDKLSTRRAEVVRAYLVDKGLDPAKLEAVGVGTSQPIGREQAPERRVEFKLDDDGP